ncbi:hypothetical protein [Aminirod propionatiphilus]|uniref:Uncharacterized protein n=1 Tax=Aminirod propionatiphilus TaxID=3415223 RepID=A0ACD1DXN1_9BACT|nr:hypothetical protein KIH16_04385 [Synergistota bacterium]
MTNRLSIGIDPGKEGAVAFVDADTLALLWIGDCPTLSSGEGGKRIYDEAGMLGILRARLEYLAEGGQAMCTVEQQQAMSRSGMKQGVVSTGQTCEWYGFWRGLVMGLGIPCSIVNPRRWQAKLFRGRSMSGDTKSRSIARAATLFPGIELTPPRCRKPRDGRADAALIAYYGAMIMNGRV